jgi:hypothetical protein
MFMFLFELYSAIAQWWSIRLLTEGLQVRVLLAEPQNPEEIRGFLYKYTSEFILGFTDIIRDEIKLSGR